MLFPRSIARLSVFSRHSEGRRDKSRAHYNRLVQTKVVHLFSPRGSNLLPIYNSISLPIHTVTGQARQKGYILPVPRGYLTYVWCSKILSFPTVLSPLVLRQFPSELYVKRHGTIATEPLSHTDRPLVVIAIRVGGCSRLCIRQRESVYYIVESDLSVRINVTPNQRASENSSEFINIFFVLD